MEQFDKLLAGESKVLMDVEGSGIVTRMWFTIQDRSPEMLRSLGKGMAEFKRVGNDVKRTLDREVDKAEAESRKREVDEELARRKAEKAKVEAEAAKAEAETAKAEAETAKAMLKLFNNHEKRS